MQIKSEGCKYSLFQPQGAEIVLVFTLLAAIFMIWPYLALFGLIRLINADKVQK